MASGRDAEPPSGDLDGEPHQHPRTFHLAATLIWCALIALPLVQALVGGGTVVGHAARLLGAVAFLTAALLLAAGSSSHWPRLSVSSAASVAAFSAMLAIAAAMNVRGDGNWIYLFFYCAGFASQLSDRRLIYPAASLTVIGAGLVSWLSGGRQRGVFLGDMLSAAGIALVMLLVRDLEDRNVELRRARSDLAQLAVAAERERFARDLHDLLGHSLTLIAIKAQLAGRLIAGGDQDRAAAEIGDIESAARESLSEVREAVGGYRRTDLAEEIVGARAALQAAGFDCVLDGPPDDLPSERAAVLAWTVREGATNVLRHSDGSSCRISFEVDRGMVCATVHDDGSGTPAAKRAAGGGNGLAGLRERVQSLGGTLAAGPLAGGGYELAVSLPGGDEPGVGGRSVIARVLPSGGREAPG